MNGSRVDVVVVGAGIAGLAAATELQARGLDVLLCEGSDRPGGVIRSERRDGYLFERGPNTFRVGPELRAFFEAHGVEGVLLEASPASRHRFLLEESGLVPVPLGPLALVRTPLLSARGKLRLLKEPFVRRGDPTGESVAQFAARRLGAEVVERLVAPFLVGVYAGDEQRLGAEAVFPSLVGFERSHGSIVRGALAGAFRRGARGLRGSFSASEGLSGLVAPLASRLGSALQLSRKVASMRPREDRGSRVWEVETEGGAGSVTYAARGVVLAAPSRDAAALLRPLDADGAELLAGIEYAPVATVALGVDPAGAREPIEGFGFLVPPRHKQALLGCLFMSRLFPGRAPAGRELLTCMYGGVRTPQVLEEPDDALARRAEGDVSRTLGLRGEIRTLAIARWQRAVPQPDADHVRRVGVLRERLAPLPPLALAGAYLEGVSLGDSAVCGAGAGRRLAERLCA